MRWSPGPVAAWVALMTAYTEEVLVAMAYTYLVSPIVEWALTRGRRPALPPAPTPDLPAGPAATA